MNTHPTTKLVNQDQPMTLFGEKTPRAVIYKSESHKLHQAFCVKENKVIHQGMPVALDTDGNIEPYIPGGDGSQVYLGIAVTDNINPAYQAQRDFPVEVTVAVEALHGARRNPAMCHHGRSSQETGCLWEKRCCDAGSTVKNHVLSE